MDLGSTSLDFSSSRRLGFFFFCSRCVQAVMDMIVTCSKCTVSCCRYIHSNGKKEVYTLWNYDGGTPDHVNLCELSHSIKSKSSGDGGRQTFCSSKDDCI